MIVGSIKAIGWRASKEQGYAFGTYVPHTSVEPQLGNNHTERGKEVHRMFAGSFQDLAPGTVQK